MPLKKVSDDAAALSPSVKKQIVVNRTGLEVNMKKGRDFWYHELLKDAENHVECVPVEATHPLYVLYTSGTTGKPKGIVHSTGGYLVFNHSAYEWVFDIKEESVYWCTADVGWVTGHSSIVYAPLSHGAAIVMYEGAPDYPGSGPMVGYYRDVRGHHVLHLPDGHPHVHAAWRGVAGKA